MGWYSSTGVTDADAIHDNVAGEIDAITEATPVSGDWFVFEDTSDSDSKKKADASHLVGGGGSIPTWVQELDSAPGGTSLDEFDDDSFSGWTTVTVTGGQTIREGKDVLSIEPTSAIPVSDFNCILQSHSIVTGDAVEIAITGMVSDDLVNMVVGPVITDGTTTTSAMAMLGLQAVDPQPFLYRSGTSATLTANGISSGLGIIYASAIFYMRVEYDAADSFLCSYSGDGVTWHQHETAIARTMTPTHVGFGWNTQNDTPVNESVAIDYVRVVTV